MYFVFSQCYIQLQKDKRFKVNLKYYDAYLTLKAQSNSRYIQEPQLRMDKRPPVISISLTASVQFLPLVAWLFFNHRCQNQVSYLLLPFE